VNERYKDLATKVSFEGLLGYLNFAEGKPDARFQVQLNDAYGLLWEKGADDPWKVLYELLTAKLAELKLSGTSAFRDTKQAEAVLSLVFTKFLSAYREHHTDLLAHLSDRDLFQPFFLARAFEAVLAQGAPWEDQRRIVDGALTQLNDYVGYRPIAILESRPRGEPYSHERVRPIPLYIRGTSVAAGRYHDLIQKAMEILATTDAAIRAEAYLDPELLDELAVDPRAYDHGHPANRRPNYIFGEWDPHLLDTQGRYRRYVARQVTLDALLDRISHTEGIDPQELLFESAAVLVGTMLMAAGTSGSGPATHDSSTTLATLMPRIARYRDAFYIQLLETMRGVHASRLRQEQVATRQPFGGARQHLNQYLARHRAGQLQQRRLALVFAEMGYPQASKKEAARIPAASVRLLTDIVGRLTTGEMLAERGELAQAVQLLPEIEKLLHRGIDCGAFVDPWNILGFQGLFPLFAAREDSIHDGRIDDLVQVLQQIFGLYSRLMSEAAARGEQSVSVKLLADLRQLASWWDRFASAEVSDVHRVHGAETATSAEHVANALARWQERGQRKADLSFWREHLEGFQSPKAFALVVDALLRKEDYSAAMGLLMNWLSQAELVPLEDGDYSFRALALRWILGLAPWRAAVRQPPEAVTVPGREIWSLVKKFFDYLEANAEDYWQVPSLQSDAEQLAMPRETKGSEDESLYHAAYADVTYQDSADDDQEGTVAEGGMHESFELEGEGDRIGRHLHFLSTVARLWQVAARFIESNDGCEPASGGHGPEEECKECIRDWLKTAKERQSQLLLLLDAVADFPIPSPLGSHDSMVEYDRRRSLKEQLLYTAIDACLDTSLAIGTMEGVVGDLAEASGERPEWEGPAIRLEQALVRGDAAEARRILPHFLSRFRNEPVLFVPLADGGRPRQILRAHIAQAVLRALLTNLPGVGLIRETYRLLETAGAMEQHQPAAGRKVTEFNHLFQTGYQAVVEAIVDAAASQSPAPRRDQEVVDLLEALTRPFLALWVEHSKTLRLSVFESISSEEEWRALCEFIRRYGADLFHAKFMTLANLRGILHRGVGAHLDYLHDNPDPLHPVRLIDDLDQRVRREDALRWLGFILQALVENYEEYKDYNTTTPQSDYGENLHLLLDFLRLKAGYERHAWRLQPLAIAHEVLARRGRSDLAVSWQEAFTRLTQELAHQYREKLSALERAHGMRLRTVADRVQEQFVKPLLFDRLCALIEPAMVEARQSQGGKSFARLERELRPLTATPTGVGLDVPHWLRRVEAEVRRVQAGQTTAAVLAEGFLRVPRKASSLSELREQLSNWEKPLDES
jgi:hypothetical protein